MGRGQGTLRGIWSDAAGRPLKGVPAGKEKRPPAGEQEGDGDRKGRRGVVRKEEKEGGK